MSDSVRVAIATRHQKERWIQPPFLEVLGWHLVVADIDTDAFGTFTGDVTRTLTPRDTALAKAKAGAEQLGLRMGVASEGTIGPHPEIPFLTVDHELVAFVDVVDGYEVVESVVSPEIHAFSETWHEGLGLDDVANRADLPRHALILRTRDHPVRAIAKGIRSPAELEKAVREGLDQHREATLLVETDHRAMMSPSRQAVIEQCAWKIATRLSRLCPSCSVRGWGIASYELGLPCRECGLPSPRAARAEVHGCARCDYRVIVPRDVEGIDPAECLACNP